MITVYNIRGTNGSGKSTLARAYAGPPEGYDLPTMHGPVDLYRYASPTKRDPERQAVVQGYGCATPELATVVVGSYRTACGGLDAVPDFAKTFGAVGAAVRMLDREAPPRAKKAVVAEGILASTVWGSWGDYALKLRQGQAVLPAGAAQVAFCYLDTPVEVCLERIRKRQEAAGKVREINEQMVRDKVRAIAATRARALAAGELVYDLPWEEAETAFRAILINDLWVAPLGTLAVPARDRYRAS